MVSPPTPPAAATTPAPFKSTLSAAAAPFVPSWLPVAYDDEYAYAYDDDASALEIPDDELFDALTPEELRELEQVDEINAMLADLELMETHNELYQEHQKACASSSPSDVVDAELRNLNVAKKPTKHVEHYSKQQQHASSASRMPKKSFYMKKNVFAPIQQPRSVK